ncbi:MAG: VWA domain-containing protein [Chitinophagales bacterium]|nr:VWA domain-containing protein [Chitinophagales bacterium]MDW8393173.1 VWA domain-containing protein [Chitinophagales bacterium]
MNIPLPKSLRCFFPSVTRQGKWLSTAYFSSSCSRLFGLAAFWFLVTTCISQAQPDAPALTRILFVLDASSSMNEAWGAGTRLSEAKRVIVRLADSLNGSSRIHLGLRVYGHQFPSHESNCQDSRLEVPLAAHNAASIKVALARLRPTGITPIGYALQEAASDFPSTPAGRNIIVLLTDGLESCQADPCAISLELQRKGVILRPFVIGLNLADRAEATLGCIGSYYNATSPSALQDAMQTAMERVLQAAGLQINLLDARNRPLETDVPMSFRDHTTGTLRYLYYHTLTDRGIPDTVAVDAVPLYHLTVHTVPALQRGPVQVRRLHPDTVNVPAAQGFLRVELAGKTVNQNLNNKIKALLYRQGDSALVDVLQLGETRKYLCGTYRLELLTLPRITHEQITISQSHTTIVTLPQPGILSINKSYVVTGSLFVRQQERWIKLYALNENLNTELIGLQAGTYALVYRPKAARQARQTKVMPVTIRSGETTTIRL